MNTTNSIAEEIEIYSSFCKDENPLDFQMSQLQLQEVTVYIARINEIIPVLKREYRKSTIEPLNEIMTSIMNEAKHPLSATAQKAIVENMAIEEKYMVEKAELCYKSLSKKHAALVTLVSAFKEEYKMEQFVDRLNR